MTDVIVVSDAVAGGEIAAGIIAELVEAKPDAVIGIATGSTPLSTYEALSRRAVDLSRVHAFALDEYVGLAKGHPESYSSFISREIVAPLGLNPLSVHVPNAVSPATAGAEFERSIDEAGGIDLQLLGLGTNGHIGFNEPGSSFTSSTRVQALDRQTRLDNSRFFPSLDEVPTHAVTQGIGTILRARRLVMLAFGRGKADAVAACLEGVVSPDWPGSAIQLHPHATVLIDLPAASGLSELFVHLLEQEEPRCRRSFLRTNWDTG